MGQEDRQGAHGREARADENPLDPVDGVELTGGLHLVSGWYQVFSGIET